MIDAVVTTYVIAESSEGGQYWAGHRWTPAENEAAEYELWGDAEAIIAAGLDGRDAIVLTREYASWADAEAQNPSYEVWE